MRRQLGVLILGFAGMLMGVVAFFSPYDPVVGPYVEIETLWAIEDARMESEEPLVTALSNHGVPLAFDEQKNTFYCTLGLDQGIEWPQLQLTAQNVGRGGYALFCR